MTVKTGGPIRGLIGRWFMRFEAAGGILTQFFSGTTAISALSGVLSYAGYRHFVPYIAVGWLLMIPIIAVAYSDGGIMGRKNRERADYGKNWASPQSRIDDEMIARGWLAGEKGDTLSDDERDAIAEELDAAFRDLSDGVEIER